MSRIKLLLLAAVVAVLLAPAAAMATNYGTIQATTVSNTALLSGNNINGDTPAYAFDTYVQNITADTLDKPADERGAAASGETVCFLYTINNAGNSPDSFYVSFTGAPNYSNGASGWGFQIGIGSETLTWGDNAAGPGDSIPTGIIAEDGTIIVCVAIGVGAVGVAPDLSTGGCSFTVGSDTAYTSQYTGDNGIVYAWAISDSGTNNAAEDIVTVSGPAFSLTKVCTGASLGGVYRADVIPGASVYYAIEFTNYGSGDGDSIYITDTIDTVTTVFADTWLVDNAASDSAAKGGNGMRLEVQDAENTWCWPEHANYDWLIANPEAIKAIRWEQDTLVPGSNAVLHYRVTVR